METEGLTWHKREIVQSTSIAIDIMMIAHSVII